MIPRAFHRIYAWWSNAFWLPCPRCGRMFGGHEEFGTPLPVVGEQGVAQVSCERCYLDPIDAAAEQVRAWGYGLYDTGRALEVIEGR